MPNDSAKIILAVTNGKLSKVRDALAIEGTINALKVEFQFRTHDWDDTIKTAVFIRGRATPSTTNAELTYVILDENNECDVPSEILEKNGIFSVGVFGEYDGYRIVSNWMSYRVENGCYADGSTPVDPNSSAYNQLIKMIQSKSNIGHNHDERYYTKEETEDRFIFKDALVQSDWNQNDSTATDYIKNRPFYTTLTHVEDVVLQGDLDFNNILNTGMSILHGIRLPESFKLTEGDICIINLDGISYECEAYVNSSEFLIVGNDKWFSGGEDNDFPFVITDVSGYWCMGIEADGVHIVSIIHKQNREDVHKIDIKYLSDSIATKPKSANITLLATDWVGEVSPYSQVVNISGVTPTSKIDLQPTAAQLVELQDAEITLMAENNNGTTTIYALNKKPTINLTMQVLITEIQTI